jgi:hypothetical protein
MSSKNSSVKKLKKLMTDLDKATMKLKKSRRGGFSGLIGHKANQTNPFDVGVDFYGGSKKKCKGAALLGGWENLSGIGGALMGGESVGGKKRRGRPRKNMGSALLGGWESIAGTHGGALMGGESVGGKKRGRPRKNMGSALMGGWENMSGTMGGAKKRGRPRKSRAGEMVGGEMVGGESVGGKRRGRARKHMGGMNNHLVGTDWINMPGYGCGGRAQVNFSNEESFYNPPPYISSFYEDNAKELAREDMKTRNRNAYGATHNTAGLTGSGKKRKVSHQIPSQLGPWMEVVAHVREKHPGMAYQEVLQVAKRMYHGN